MSQIKDPDAPAPSRSTRAAAAVGRIFLNAPDGSGSGFATGFLVAPGLILTNWHVLRNADWARGATLTMDAEEDVTTSTSSAPPARSSAPSTLPSSSTPTGARNTSPAATTGSTSTPTTTTCPIRRRPPTTSSTTPPIP